MGTLLEIRDLRVRFLAARGDAQQALDGVSFELVEGETLGVIGESGCGKTTLALALLGLLRRTQAEISGQAIFRGGDLLRMPEDDLRRIRASAISLIFQEPALALSPVIRAGPQIAEVLHAHRGWSWKRCRAEAAALLARVGLAERRFFDSYPHQLSGGQCQRVVLAQALACRPALLIADEPTASLDAIAQVEFIRLIIELRREFGLSLLLISHQPELHASLSDRLLVLERGRVIESGNFHDLWRRSSLPLTRALLDRASSASGLNSRLPVEEHAKS